MAAAGAVALPGWRPPLIRAGGLAGLMSGLIGVGGGVASELQLQLAFRVERACGPVIRHVANTHFDRDRLFAGVLGLKRDGKSRRDDCP